MPTWTRAVRDTESCGKCGEAITVGEPMRTYRLPGVTSVKVRCAACADDPVPTDLPRVADRVPGTAPPPVDLSRLGQRFSALPLDGKALAIGREPGEDDV